MKISVTQSWAPIRAASHLGMRFGWENYVIQSYLDDAHRQKNDLFDVFKDDTGRAIYRAASLSEAQLWVAVDVAFSVMRSALTQAESFISGFEGDELQEGIPELLATIRAAIGGEAHAHAVSQAPADAYLERFPADQRATANRTYQDGFVDGAESERGTWQDISTAPTNGDHILIARMPDHEPSMPEGVIAHWAHSKHGWGWYANGIGFITDTGIYVPGNGMVSDNGWEDLRPTHWLALPEGDAA